jgi:hypothetical protein
MCVGMRKSIYNCNGNFSKISKDLKNNRAAVRVAAAAHCCTSGTSASQNGSATTKEQPDVGWTLE